MYRRTPRYRGVNTAQSRLWAKKLLIKAPMIVLLIIFIHTYVQLIQAVVTFREWPSYRFGHNVGSTILAVYDAGLIMTNSFIILFDSETTPIKSSLPSINLKIDPGSLDKMLTNLPKSAKEKYYLGMLAYPDGSWQRVEYRLRGRSPYHWHKQKPSIRIKTQKSNPINLQRHINLINPEDRAMVSNVIGEDIATKLGVIAPQTVPARLFLNGDFKGVYHLSTHEDESWLRLRRRVPGPLFIGNWLKPIWDLKDFQIKGDLDVLDRFNPMQTMLDALVLPNGPERHERLWGILSKDQYARYLSTMALAGSTHTDSHHNHIYYFDPANGLLESAINDINGHGLLSYPAYFNRLRKPWKPEARLNLNGTIHQLNAVALRDPDLRHLRNIALYEALNGVASVKSQHQWLDEYFIKIDPDARADRQKGAIEETFIGMWRMPYANIQYDEAKAQVYQWVSERNSFLLAELERASASVALKQLGQRQWQLAVTVGGNSAVKLNPAVLGGRLLADRNLDGTPEMLVEEGIILHPGLTFHDDSKALLDGKERYLFTLNDAQGDVRNRIKSAFVNAVSGANVEAIINDTVNLTGPSWTEITPSVHPWRYANEKSDTLVLGPGIVMLTEDLIITSQQHLRVRPGTTLRLAPKVSIIAKGQIQMEGTKEAPIKIERLNATQAWGAVVVHGPTSNGSILRHMIISGGSFAQANNVLYSGMVSSHWSDDFVIEDSIISNNILSDDTFHVVNGTFSANNITLNNCYADCIDLDYVKGTINQLEINNSGNDGVDMMASEIRLTNIKIQGADDKGLSVGEGTILTVEQLRVDMANIAIAVKDKSITSLNGALLSNNDVAVDVYAKNWRFGGPGQIILSQTQFIDNQVNVRHQEGGSVRFLGQIVPDRISGDGRVISEPSKQSGNTGS